MMGRSARPLDASIAASICCSGSRPPPCAAQPPAVATAATDARASRAAGGPAAVDGVPRHRTLHETERPGLARAAAARRSPAMAEGRRQVAIAAAAAVRPERRTARACRGRARPVADRRRRPSPLATDREARTRAVRADRPPLPDQPGHRPAALRRPAADRGRGAGQGLGRRGRADAGQGPLGPRAQHRLSTTSATTAAARTSTRAS